ncbi:MAG: SCO family protein [Ardenticatenaceae bacterium]|nr:SCO family protein [Ardenticatenaceae bacterium]
MDILTNLTHRKRTILVAALALLLVLVVGLGASLALGVGPWSGGQAHAEEQITADEIRSGRADFLHRPVDRPAPDFTLTDQNGRRVSLSDFRGKWVVMTWIYTHCMTVCPALKAEMKIVQTGLGDAVGRDVQLVIITFDPERDTPEVMKADAQKLKADIPGWSWLTGTKAETDAVADAYGVAFAPKPNGMFDHTALVTLVDPQGHERHRYFGSGWSQDLLDRLQQVLPQASSASQDAKVSMSEAAHSPATLADEVRRETRNSSAEHASAAPAEDARIASLEALANAYAYDESELREGVTSQEVLEFSEAATAAEYVDTVKQQAIALGRHELESGGGPEDTIQYHILKAGPDQYLAVGRAQNLVIRVEGFTFQAARAPLMIQLVGTCCV